MNNTIGKILNNRKRGDVIKLDFQNIFSLSAQYESVYPRTTQLRYMVRSKGECEQRIIARAADGRGFSDFRTSSNSPRKEYLVISSDWRAIVPDD